MEETRGTTRVVLKMGCVFKFVFSANGRGFLSLDTNQRGLPYDTSPYEASPRQGLYSVQNICQTGM